MSSILVTGGDPSRWYYFGIGTIPEDGHCEC
jgi:hypothetical protein